jgi:hypothetical protein
MHDVLHLKCFTIASSEVAVLVRTSWRGHLHELLIGRDHMVRRHLVPNMLGWPGAGVTDGQHC